MKSISKTDEAKIKCAIDKAIDRYISTRRQRIPAFVARNFSFKGALALHRKAVGRDLYRSPLNIAWALPYMISRLLSGPLNAVGYPNAA